MLARCHNAGSKPCVEIGHAVAHLAPEFEILRVVIFKPPPFKAQLRVFELFRSLMGIEKLVILGRHDASPLSRVDACLRALPYITLPCFRQLSVGGRYCRPASVPV